MTRVYVLTRGEYSDYRVFGVFSSPGAIEAFRANLHEDRRGDFNDPEEFEVDGCLMLEYRPRWRAVIELEGGEILGTYDQGISLTHPSEVVARETYAFIPGHPGRYVPALEASSPISREHAVKVATEKRQEWLRTRSTGAR